MSALYSLAVCFIAFRCQRKSYFCVTLKRWTQLKSELLGVIFILLQCSKRPDKVKTWYLPCEFPSQSLYNELLIEDLITQTVVSQICYLCYVLARGKTWHFATPPLFSPWNGVWETRAETPYLWHNTAHIWVVLLTGWKFASSNQKPLINFSYKNTRNYIVFKKTGENLKQDLTLLYKEVTTSK